MNYYILKFELCRISKNLNILNLMTHILWLFLKIDFSLVKIFNKHSIIFKL